METNKLPEATLYDNFSWSYFQEFILANDPQAEREYLEHNRRFYEDVRRG